jgi:hypothetical protein
MVPLTLLAVVLLAFIKEKPLATTIERDILPETLEIDGMTNVCLEEPAHAEAASLSVSRRLPA